MRSALLAIAVAGLGAALPGCLEGVDPPWQLDHDRVVAVRATPPGIPAGGRSELDGLIARVGLPTIEQSPELAIVASPASLQGALARDGDRWVVTAPDEAALAAARVELDLDPDEPVPLLVGVSYLGGSLEAVKVVELGVAADNPVLGVVEVDGAPAPDAELVVGSEVDVPLSVPGATDDDEVNWLTSCGTMHDFDLPQAYLRVEPDDPTSGELVVVVRDDRRGVTWKVWPIRAE